MYRHVCPLGLSVYFFKYKEIPCYFLFNFINNTFSATLHGKGVYFAVNAEYSCSTKFSPADSQGNRYMYYANVLVGEYTKGDPNMIVAPNKGTSDPNERYDSVVNDVAKPTMYVLFQDYEYYTEYLITFR